MKLLGHLHVRRCTRVCTPCLGPPCPLNAVLHTRRLYVIAFLWGFVQYEAKGRISAEAALRHAYFKSLGERVHLLPDSKCPPSSCTWSKELLCSPRVVVCSQVVFRRLLSLLRGAPAAEWGGSLVAGRARNNLGREM